MKKLLSAFVGTFCLVAMSPAFFVAGTFNGWDPGSTPMTDLGGGKWEVTLSGLGSIQRHEFKVTDGTWGWSVPGSGNSWFYSWTDGMATLGFDTNSYSDGWSPEQYRRSIDVTYSAWVAVGDWQGWDNNSASTGMTWAGDVLFYEQTLAPGTYQYKAVGRGTWDAIGADGNSVNADTISFETTTEQNLVRFYVDPFNGTARVEVVPEPATMLALGVGVAALLRRRLKA